MKARPTVRALPSKRRSLILPRMKRPYERIAARLETRVGSREELTRQFLDAAWDALHSTGVSWIGFYCHQSGEELVLTARRDKPACSPIGLHGVCGQGFLQRKPVVVRDVRDLGDNYIACDPRDRSELVIPLFSQDGACWGVLDLDSHDVGAFDEDDVQALQELLRIAGLSQ